MGIRNARIGVLLAQLMALPDTRRRLATASLLALLAILLIAPPARAAATQDLSGEWLNSAYTFAAYKLQMSADRKTLSVTWVSKIGNIDEGLAGGFTGRLNASGTAFAGSMHIDAGSLRVNGTMTVAISSQRAFGYPLLTVSYQQDNGVGGSLTLETWLRPPRVSPGLSQPATFVFACPGPQRCQARADAQALGSGAGGKVGTVRFTINPRASRAIRLPLDKTGRALLAHRGSLRVRVLVSTLTQSLKLPSMTALGPVTFRK